MSERPKRKKAREVVLWGFTRIDCWDGRLCYEVCERRSDAARVHRFARSMGESVSLITALRIPAPLSLFAKKAKR